MLDVSWLDNLGVFRRQKNNELLSSGKSGNFWSLLSHFPSTFLRFSRFYCFFSSARTDDNYACKMKVPFEVKNQKLKCTFEYCAFSLYLRPSNLIWYQTDGLDRAFICFLFISEQPVLGTMMFNIFMNYLKKYVKQITVIRGSQLELIVKNDSIILQY